MGYNIEDADDYGWDDKTLRDEFAMAALRGGVSGIEYPETMKTEKLAKIIAETAYEIADAMMEAR